MTAPAMFTPVPFRWLGVKIDKLISNEDGERFLTYALKLMQDKTSEKMNSGNVVRNAKIKKVLDKMNLTTNTTPASVESPSQGSKGVLFSKPEPRVYTHLEDRTIVVSPRILERQLKKLKEVAVHAAAVIGEAGILLALLTPLLTDTEFKGFLFVTSGVVKVCFILAAGAVGSDLIRRLSLLYGRWGYDEKQLMKELESDQEIKIE